MTERRTFTWTWLVATVFAFVLVGLGTYSLTSYLTSELDENSDTAANVCMERNEQLKRINARFSKLTDLLDAAIAQGDAPPAPEVTRLFDELKVTIPSVSCERLRQ
jgi:hypothetical protein